MGFGSISLYALVSLCSTTTLLLPPSPAVTTRTQFHFFDSPTADSNRTANDDDNNNDRQQLPPIQQIQTQTMKIAIFFSLLASSAVVAFQPTVMATTRKVRLVVNVLRDGRIHDGCVDTPQSKSLANASSFTSTKHDSSSSLQTDTLTEPPITSVSLPFLSSPHSKSSSSLFVFRSPSWPPQRHAI